MRFLKLPLLLTLGLFVSATAASGAARYARFGVIGATLTQATGINSYGTVVGFYFDSQYSGHGFVRNSSGNITTFDVPGASEGNDQGTYAQAINDAGVIAGTYSTASASFHGFLRDASGNFTTFDVPGETMPGYTFGPQGINDAGQVAGVSVGSTTDDDFLMQGDGTFTTFTPGGGYAAFVGINSVGEVAGSYFDTTYRAYHGFFRDASGKVTTFDVPGAVETTVGEGTWADSLNDSGVVAGVWVDTSYVVHAYLRAPAGTIQSYDVPGAITFAGTYINNSAIVAGTLVTSSYAYQGFIRDRAGHITTFVVPNSSPKLGAASTGVNGKGQICGFFVSQGVQYSFLRTP